MQYRNFGKTGKRLSIITLGRMGNMAQGRTMSDFGKFRCNMFQLDQSRVLGQFANHFNSCGDCFKRCLLKLDIPGFIRAAHSWFLDQEKREAK